MNFSLHFKHYLKTQDYAMLEYIFFNNKTDDLFEKSVTSSGITPILDCEDEYFNVRLDEDSDEGNLES